MDKFKDQPIYQIQSMPKPGPLVMTKTGHHICQLSLLMVNVADHLLM